MAPPSSRGGATVTRSASSPATRTDTAAGAAGGPVEAEVQAALQPSEVQVFVKTTTGVEPASGTESVAAVVVVPPIGLLPGSSLDDGVDGVMVVVVTPVAQERPWQIYD